MNGLNIVPEIVKKRKNSVQWMEKISCILWMTGFIKTIFSGFPSLDGTWEIFALGSSVGILILFQLLDTKYGKWTVPSGTIAFCALLFINLSKVVNGIGNLVNDFLDYLTGKSGKIYLAYPVSKETGVFLAAALLLFLLLLCLTAISVKNRKILICFLTIGCLCGCMTGLFSKDSGVILLVLGLFLLFAGNGYEGNKLKSLISTALPAVCLAAVCTLLMISAGKMMMKSVSFESETEKLKFLLHKSVYDTGTDAMPEGNLMNVGAFEKNEETALRLTMETPQKIYLKGMTGEVYTGISWEGMDQETYRKWEDLFYWLHKKAFYGQTMIAAVNDMKTGTEEKTLKIINEGACREHLYLPYALSDSTVLLKDAVGDDRTRAAEKETEITYFQGSVPQWYQLAMWLVEHQNSPEVKEYLKAEESYREYVYENDLQLTNTVVGAFENLFSQDQRDERSLTEILEFVRTTLEQELIYDEKAETLNGKNDFAKYTLEQSKRGYSPHYATLATLMLRYMGVPARYAEGYFLSGKEAQDYKENEEIVLTEAHAHAWTEYYMDGVGWIPFEVTPGYIDEEEWNDTSAVLADGLGEETGKGFVKSSLTYTPPKLPESDTQLPNLKSMMRFEAKHVFAVFLVLLLLLLGVVTAKILKRRMRLKNFYKKVNESTNRQCVAELYGYAMMLNEKFHIAEKEAYQREKKINELARFSTENIEEAQRTVMEAFADTMVKECEKSCTFLQKIKYRYILWLF